MSPPRVACPSQVRAETAELPAPSASIHEAGDSGSDDALDAAFEAELDVGSDDPLRPFNERMFALDRFVDRWLLNPLARGYGWITPDPVERAVRRVFANLDEPARLVNHVLQGEGRRAGTTGARFVVNSTLGLAGLVDVAKHLGLNERPADFGQTLGKAGVASGPYLYLPLLGPTNPRDLLGSAIDSGLHAESWLLPLRVEIAFESVDALSLKESYRTELESLERTSIDYYAALRAGAAMQRKQSLEDRSCPPVQKGD